MEKTLHQVGELLLGSVPAIIFLLLSFGLYRLLVYKPLSRVLAERYTQTEGAFEQAKADIAAAEARTAEYEQRIREARLAIFKAQEQRREQALKARYAAAQEARAAAEGRIAQERANLEQQALTARAGLEQQADQLANEIIRAVLHPAAVAQSPAGGR
jgi:F-type H+-transporting ATPase subunit b